MVGLRSKNSLFALIVLSNLFSTNLKAQECGTTPLQKLVSVFSSCVKPAMVQNVRQFCDENVNEGVGELAFSIPKAEMLRILNDPEKISELVQKNTDNPWQLSLFPNEKLRLKAAKSTTWLPLNSDEYISALKVKAAPLSSAEINDITATIKELFTPPKSTAPIVGVPLSPGAPAPLLLPPTEQKEASLLDSSIARTAVCGTVTALHSLKCEKDLSRIRQIVSEQDGYSLPEENLEVLTNEKYREGLRLAALKLVSRAKEGKPAKGDLFGDIKDSFISSGIASKDAEDMTWTVLAAISAAGPNYGSRALSFGNQSSNLQTKEALTIIAQTIPLLNQLSRDEDRLYAYPPGMKTSCDNGKSYHFWMSAYLARKLTLESGDPKAAAAAVYTAEKGYQFLSRTQDRSPERALIVDTFDPFNNVMRMDLTYAAAGAKFGSCVKLNCASSINIDEGVKKIVEKSMATPSVSKKDSEDLFRNHPLVAFEVWSIRFAPQSVFDLYN